jgi:hypothetical protein
MRGKAKIQVIEDFNLFDPPITYINEELVEQLIESNEHLLVALESCCSDYQMFRYLCDMSDKAIKSIREQMNEQ